MKKIFLLIVLSAALQPLFAQSLKLGIKAGLNESTADFGQSSSATALTGFNTGVFGEITLGKISVEPGAYFTTAGYYNHTAIFLLDPGPNSFSVSGAVTIRYLQIPVNVLYNIRAKPFKIFIGGGPYFGFALSGTEQGQPTFDGNATGYTTRNLTFGRNGNYSNTDYGLNAEAGVRLRSGLSLSVDYGYGLANIEQAASEGTEKNRVLSVSLGYEFL